MGEAGVRRIILATAIIAGALAACVTPPPAQPVASARPGPPPLAITAGSLWLPDPRGAAHDTCNVGAFAYLIGLPRTQIPVPVDLSRRRVACTTCPMATDVRADRLNILYDPVTNRVAKLTCG